MRTPNQGVLTPGLHFGAAYYAEYRPGRPIDEDLDLMKAAGFTVIRVGESVWSTWEPVDGEFDVEWLRPVLDGAHRRGIAVILGTPTYAIPPWLQTKHPELAAESPSGHRIPWGGRQEVDYSSPVFRKHAERIIREVVATYCTHPAVIGYQLDNEPGSHLFHNDHVFTEFRRRLALEYLTVEALNAAWGLTYWSHRLTSFDELWRPDGNSFPQYDLAWRSFQADLTTEFIEWQAGIVREYAMPQQFVTTCMAYPRRAMHDAQLAAGLDIVAGNPYYDTQDGLYLASETLQAPSFAVAGVGPFFRQADRMWSGRHERFLVTETNAQTIGGHSTSRPPYPGQLKQAAYGLVSRGAELIEYWQWQTLNHGAETYWGGVLPHSGKPGRIFAEISEIGRSFSAVGPSLTGFVPDADIALLYSNASKWAFESTPPLQAPDGGPDRESYMRIFDAFHTGIVASNRQAVIVHDTQLQGLDPTEYASAQPILIAPAFYIASDANLQWLRDYVKSGGHLVVGIRTAYADTIARAREEVAPPRLDDLVGAHYEEFSIIRNSIQVRGSEALTLSTGAAATGWIDGLIIDDATVLAHYEHPEFGTFPAITTRRDGAGRVTYVGTVPNARLAIDFAEWLVPEPQSNGWIAEPAGRTTVQSGMTDKGRVRFIFNWSGDRVALTIAHACTDLETEEHLMVGSQVHLEPRATRVLLEDPRRP